MQNGLHAAVARAVGRKAQVTRKYLVVGWRERRGSGGGGGVAGRTDHRVVDLAGGQENLALHSNVQRWRGLRSADGHIGQDIAIFRNQGHFQAVDRRNVHAQSGVDEAHQHVSGGSRGSDGSRRGSHGRFIERLAIHQEIHRSVIDRCGITGMGRAAGDRPLRGGGGGRDGARARSGSACSRWASGRGFQELLDRRILCGIDFAQQQRNTGVVADGVGYTGRRSRRGGTCISGTRAERGTASRGGRIDNQNSIQTHGALNGRIGSCLDQVGSWFERGPAIGLRSRAGGRFSNKRSYARSLGRRRERRTVGDRPG